MSAVGVAVLAAVLALATWRPLPAKTAGLLVLTDAVIDFGQRTDKATFRVTLDNVLRSQSIGDFTVEVNIVDNRTGEVLSTGPQPPTVVR